MLVTHDELIALVRNGFIRSTCPQKELFGQVNGASIDIHLGDTFLTERLKEHTIVDPWAKSDSHLREITTPEYVLRPGEFVLAHSEEFFDLPLDISCWVTLKSSMARAGLDHSEAGYADPGWHGSQMTFELRNNLQYHAIRLQAGKPIAQVVVFRGEPVPLGRSYKARGQYNEQAGVVAGKGAK